MATLESESCNICCSLKGFFTDKRIEKSGLSET